MCILDPATISVAEKLQVLQGKHVEKPAFWGVRIKQQEQPPDFHRGFFGHKFTSTARSRVPRNARLSAAWVRYCSSQRKPMNWWNLMNNWWNLMKWGNRRKNMFLIAAPSTGPSGIKWQLGIADGEENSVKNGRCSLEEWTFALL